VLARKGLSEAKPVKRVSGRWVDLWRSKKDSTIRMLLGDMLTILRAHLIIVSTIHD